MCTQPIETKNIVSNTDLWDLYARTWSPETCFRENYDSQGSDLPLEILGEEWGTKKDVEKVIEDFIYPYVTSEDNVAEIGSGAGRLAIKIAPIVKTLICLDISDEMLSLCRHNLRDVSNVEFRNLRFECLSNEFEARLTFIYAFDVFVHVDLHTMWRLLQQCWIVLACNGHIFIHTSNLFAPRGWDRFASQEDYQPSGFYFVTPDIVKHLLIKVGFAVVRESNFNEPGFYHQRDYMVVAVKI